MYINLYKASRKITAYSFVKRQVCVVQIAQISIGASEQIAKNTENSGICFTQHGFCGIMYSVVKRRCAQFVSKKGKVK